MNVSTLKAQGRTLVTADHARELWTRDEIEFVVAMTNDERDEDIAIALGRSLYALWAIQYRIRREGVAGVLMRGDAAQTAPVVRTCATHHIALTATGACDWCDDA